VEVDLFPILVGASLALGAAYGLIFLPRPPSLTRTVVKCAGVVMIAAIALIDGSPRLLPIGLALCAVGDVCLAQDRRALPYGLAAFLAGHVAYILLFWQTAESFGGLDRAPWRLGLAGLAAVTAALLLAWLWRDLGRLRWPVVAYVATILPMVGTSLGLPIALATAMIGAGMFLASDALLSVQIFKAGATWAERREAGLAIWFLYFLGQWGIAAAFIRPGLLGL
jgi:uncharacterized membrane protein YhhN